MALLILFLLCIAALVMCAIAGVWAGEPRRPSKKARAYIAELEGTIDNLRSLAYDHKDLDPTFADVVIDEIKQHHTRVKTADMKNIKELE